MTECNRDDVICLFANITRTDFLHKLCDHFNSKIKDIKLKYNDYRHEIEKPSSLHEDISFEEWKINAGEALGKRMRFTIGKEAKETLFLCLTTFANSTYKERFPQSTISVEKFLEKLDTYTSPTHSLERILTQFCAYYLHKVMQIKLNLGRNYLAHHRSHVGTIASSKYIKQRHRLIESITKHVQQFNLVLHCLYFKQSLPVLPLKLSEIIKHTTGLEYFYSLLPNDNILHFEIEKKYFEYQCERQRIVEEFALLFHELQNSISYLSKQISFMTQNLEILPKTLISTLTFMTFKTDSEVYDDLQDQEYAALLFEFWAYRQKYVNKRNRIIAIKDNLICQLSRLKNKIMNDSILLSRIRTSSLSHLVEEL